MKVENSASSTYVFPQAEKKFLLTHLAATTTTESLIEWIDRWAQSRMVTSFPVGTSCCSFDLSTPFMASENKTKQICELNIYEPHLSNILIVAGTVTLKLLPVIKRVYSEMPDEKWVMAVGSCAATGGPYQSYNVVPGIGEHIPVDVYVPGCPPSPRELFSGLELLHERIQSGVCAARAKETKGGRH